MEIKIVYIVIHDATVDRNVSASRKCFSFAEKTLMCRRQMSGVTRCSDQDHLLRCGQTVAPRGCVIMTFQCTSTIYLSWKSHLLFRSAAYIQMYFKTLRTLIRLLQREQSDLDPYCFQYRFSKYMSR